MIFMWWICFVRFQTSSSKFTQLSHFLRNAMSHDYLPHISWRDSASCQGVIICHCSQTSNQAVVGLEFVKSSTNFTSTLRTVCSMSSWCHQSSQARLPVYMAAFQCKWDVVTLQGVIVQTNGAFYLSHRRPTLTRSRRDEVLVYAVSCRHQHVS